MPDLNPELISEDDFFEQYKPEELGPDGDTIIDVIPPGTPRECVWTIVEGDSGNLYASAGVHFVNRLGYIVTEQPWSTGDEEAVWHLYDDDTADDTAA